MPSDLITRRFSTPELSQKVLEMATTGVYRESIFEALHPLATKRQIREAIAYAKRFGMHSVADLRDPELGTYYQLDQIKYRVLYGSLQAAVQAAAQPPNLADLKPPLAGLTGDLLDAASLPPADATLDLTPDSIPDSTLKVTRRMLGLAQVAAGFWAILGLLCWISGWYQVSLGLIGAAFGSGLLWSLQRRLSNLPSPKPCPKPSNGRVGA